MLQLLLRYRRSERQGTADILRGVPVTARLTEVLHGGWLRHACWYLLYVSLLSGIAHGQGWTVLPNTTWGSVSAPNNFTATFGGHTMPTYAFADNHYRIVTQWGSSWADTFRNRMCRYGGGHNGPNDNSVQCLDLTAVSTSIATCGGQSCITTSNSGSFPAQTRLTDPSVFDAVTNPSPATNYDGTPLSMQPYGGLIPFPLHDKYFSVANATVWPTNLHQTWIFDPAVSALSAPWTQKTRTATPDDMDSGKECDLDRSTWIDDVAYCAMNGNTIWTYTYGTDTWVAFTSSISMPDGASILIDPDRKRIWIMGARFDYAIPMIGYIDIASPNTLVDVTSTATGCANLAGYPGASLTWDPTLHKIVYYVPQAASAHGVQANEIGIYDPAMNTCVAQPLLPNNGPLSDNLNNQNVNQGFAYFPSLGYYVWMGSGGEIPNPPLNTYKFLLNATATNGLGLGASMPNALTCIDRDGDGYGTGPGCTGPDADDQDAGVHTTAQWLTKWAGSSSVTNANVLLGLNHRGKNPANIYYLSTTGTNAGSPPNCKNTPASPCATYAYIASFINPGDAVIWRGGSYTELVAPINSTIGLPTTYMQMPGELATFSSSGGAPDGFDLSSSQNYVDIEGFRINGSGTLPACVYGGGNSHITISEIEATSCEMWGIDLGTDSGQTLYDITVSNSDFHDNLVQHGLYFSNDGTGTSSNIFIFFNLSINNNQVGFQISGQMTNAVVSQNISASNLTAGYSWKQGISGSFLLDNVSINDNQGLAMFLYDGSLGGGGLSNCGAGGTSLCTCAPANLHSVCPYPQNNNLIKGFSAWLSGTAADGSTNVSAAAIQVGRQAGGNCVTSVCTSTHMDNNTIQDVVLYTNNTGLGDSGTPGSYPSIQFPDNTGVTFLPTTTLKNIVEQNITASGPATHQVGYGPGASFGLTPYTCAQLVTNGFVAAATGCSNGDPKFVSTCAYNNVASCNLKLQASSPAVGTGSFQNGFDVIGTAIPATSPNMGAFQGTSGSPPPTVQSVIFGGNVRK